MKVFETPIAGLLRIRPEVHGDDRGFFLESFHAKKFAALGIPHLFVQDNHSRSARGVLRGLHFQKRHPQGKLVRVLSGSLFDVAVDVRSGSPTFGRWFGMTLSANEPEFLYLPEGMAHGFLALEDRTELFYKCTDFYDAADEGGVRWDDPAIGIAWPAAPAVLSPKDAAYPLLSEISPEDLPRL
ncbi:MAG: dTDP-4-dehydrorhamnose 3,5-epimerase [Nitrospirae bacterium]|nr:dTDP-4-dehydrorhamnose 3,5-epimerase [Nitrospirota bacterium]